MSKKPQAPVQITDPEPNPPAPIVEPERDLSAPIVGVDPEPVEIKPDEPIEPQPLLPEEPERTMLMAKRHVRAAVNDGVLTLLGGDFVTDGRHVAQLEHDAENFVVIRVPASKVGVVERMWHEEMFALRMRAGDMGCHVVKDGTTKMPRFGG